MAVRNFARRCRLVPMLLGLAVMTGTMWWLYGMISWKRTDLSKVKAIAVKFVKPDRVPLRPPLSLQLQSEDGWFEEEEKTQAATIARVESVINITRFQSIFEQDDTVEELGFNIGKTREPVTPNSNPKIEADASNHSNEISTNPPQITPHMVANETCDKTCRWWREQDNRQRRVRETCAAILRKPIRPIVHHHLNQQTLRTMSSLLVLDSHKLVYCYVPKVSCTNWKRIFLVAKGIFPSVQDIEQRETHIATDSHIRTLSSYPLSTASRLLKEYKTFMFVRHPFERILSAYIDKFQLDYPASKHFRETNAVHMARYGDFTNTPRLKDGTLNITFQQFVRYVSDPKNQRLEPHWQEMYSQCQPCMIHYDYLGTYSTLKEDADFIIKTAKLNQTFPKSTNPTGSSKQAKIMRYFSQLTSGEIDSLYRRYTVDFQLFGYSIPSYISNRTVY